ncbi:MAG: hydroxyacid dehydrogenase [Clostridia bacterium]|nr:hydroxyacid dehydrogenase [Clostridia bacterium]
MRSILISDKKQKITDVYSAALIADLRRRAALDEGVYSREEILATPERFADVEYLFSTWGMPAFTEEEIELCFPNLKCVFYAAGSVQKFARPFLEKGIKVFSAWAANAVPVAEYTLAQILLANKGYYFTSRVMSQGEHRQAKQLAACYPGNYGERVGLLGVGMIGSLVAEMLKDYRLEVLAFDPFLSDEKAKRLNVKKASLDEIFSTCRVVSNHLANNEQTVGMLNGGLFASMMPYATFINTGRGAQVVEEDLARVLGEREDLTAILDVTYPEPPVEGHPFYSLPNCILTPHIAGSMGNETHRMAEYMAEEWERYTKGEQTRYEVTLSMLATMA